MTRVANISLSRNVLLANQRNLGHTADLQKQLATGKRINQMSDDPISGRRALVFKVQRFELERYQENIAKTLTFQETTDSVFSRMGEVVDEAKGLALRGVNASEDAASRATMARSIDGLLDRMVDLGNTVHDGRFIFSGAAVLDKPFALNNDRSAVAYAGDLDDFQVSISQTTRVSVNLNGHSLFKSEVDVFATFARIRDALDDNDPEGVEELLDELDRVQNHISGKQGELGSRMQRVELTRTQIDNALVNLSELISNEEDADLAETISKLQVAETTLEAGLNAGARVLRPTLLDFI
ncbi:MAG: flagellar hook-associated protein 3 [Planctomycetota bacterium]|nr:MAG: flagellar hook-associated protein 3 [Planctomycetota bacterium]